MKTLTSENNIIIECPHCKKDNTIILNSTTCDKCDKSFSGFKFKKATASILMTGLLVSSGFFGYKQYQKNSHRYPTITEFRIIDQCVAASGQIVPKEYVSNKLMLCIDSLEKSQKNINYSEYSSNNAKFDNEFQKHLYDSVRRIQ